MRNVLRIAIVVSAIAGLILVRGMGPKPSVLSNPSQY
ncbi:MAG: hypothetical protein QOH92_1340 [Chloroflexota bacterium]|nr:hypothetical protein [Chloroflexota bacterium]